MTFDTTGCCDWPVPFWNVVIQYVISVFAGLIGQWLRYRDQSTLKVLGTLLLGCASISILAWGLYIPRWGVSDLPPLPYPLERVAFTLMAIAFFAAVGKLGGHLRSSQPATSLQC